MEQTVINRRAAISLWLPALFTSGDTRLAGVPVHTPRHGRGPRRYLVIHGDEDTAKQVLTEHMRQQSGIGYVVKSATRIVEIGGLKIDPNRLWSRPGAEASLLRLNEGADPAAVAHVLHRLDRERPAALRRLTPGLGSRLFALHNNRGYSMTDELEASDRTSLPQKDLPRNFFLCTDPRDFEILRQSPYNVVLQTQAEPDDGSLSRLAARRRFRYINLESAIGDHAGQTERVAWLESHLP